MPVRQSPLRSNGGSTATFDPHYKAIGYPTVALCDFVMRRRLCCFTVALYRPLSPCVLKTYKTQRCSNQNLHCICFSVLIMYLQHQWCLLSTRPVMYVYTISPFDVQLVLPSHHTTQFCCYRGGVTTEFFLSLQAYNERTIVKN